MLWLLVLHISAILLWSASLLYLPALIVSGRSGHVGLDQRQPLAVSRTLFTQIVTPAAMLAVVSGTAIFVTADITDPWLVLKLSLVSALVVCHALLGWVILRVDHGAGRRTVAVCLSLATASLLSIIAIITVVLMKPL